MVLKSALRGAAVAASASVGLLVTPELAGSSNFESLPGFVPNPDAFCVGTGRADSKTHTFYYENVEPVMVTALNAHRSYMDGSAQVAVKTQLLASGNSATDAYIRDQNYTNQCFRAWHGASGGYIIGLRQCIAINGAGECERSDIRFDTSFYPGRSAEEIRSLACHEVGHSLGLMHRAEQCMTETANSAIIYSDHDKAHLNTIN